MQRSCSGLTIACWKRSQAVSLPLRYSTLLLASVLVAPHLTVYDLVILAPAFILLADWLIGQPVTSSTRWLGTLLYLVYMLPLLGLFHSMDARPAFGNRDGGCGIPDLEHLSRRRFTTPGSGHGGDHGNAVRL